MTLLEYINAQLDGGASPNSYYVKNADAHYSFLYAGIVSYAENPGLLSRLLDNPELDVNMPGDSDGYLPLYVADNLVYKDVVATLLNKGANPGIMGDSGVGVIFTAAGRGDGETVALCLSADFENGRLAENMPRYLEALHLAKFNGDSAISELFAQLGITIASDTAEPSALLANQVRELLTFGEPELIAEYAELYKNAAQVPSFFPPSEQLLSLAAKYGAPNLINALGAAGLDTELVFDDGTTVVMLATATPGNTETVAAFYANGADKDAVDNFAHSAYDYAANIDMRIFLTEQGVRSGGNTTRPHNIPYDYENLYTYKLSERHDAFPAEDNNYQYRYLALDKDCKKHGLLEGIVWDKYSQQTYVICKSYYASGDKVLDAFLEGQRNGEGFYWAKDYDCNNHGAAIYFKEDAEGNIGSVLCKHVQHITNGEQTLELMESGLPLATLGVAHTIITANEAWDYMQQNPDEGFRVSSPSPFDDEQYFTVAHLIDTTGEDFWLNQPYAELHQRAEEDGFIETFRDEL